MTNPTPEQVEAAAGVTPQEPAVGLAALVRTLRECGVEDGIDMRDAVTAARAYASPMQVDEAKLENLMRKADIEHNLYADKAHAVAEGLRGGER